MARQIDYVEPDAYFSKSMKAVVKKNDKAKAEKEKTNSQKATERADVISVDSYTTEEIDLKFSQMSREAAEAEFRDREERFRKYRESHKK